MSNDDQTWHRGAVIYQIYPRSFFDTSGDGTGDLKGVIDHLDYLNGSENSLGVDAIWLSPFYPSPMADFGYDVEDYCNVDKLFGTLNDFKDLVSKAHDRGIKVLVDLIPNHSSGEHPWFIDSRSSRDSNYRSWYVWRDPKPDGSAPNNWQSIFGGSAWELDEKTGQYYLHSFLKKQPDLNWDNPEVRKAMMKVMHFWLDLGVDGFRVDAVKWMSKDPELRDDKPNGSATASDTFAYETLDHVNSEHGPKLFDYLQEIADVVKSRPGRLMIVEAYPEKWNDVDGYLEFYKQIDPSVCAPFNFEAIESPWTAASYRTFIDKFQSSLQPNYLPVYCFGNHDRSRLATRIGRESARTAAMLQLTLPGTPVIYYGDELGMVDGDIPADKVRDPYEIQTKVPKLGRDPERTPLLWDDSKNAGFTTGEPWLPIEKDYRETNIKTEQSDSKSSLVLYKELLKLRRKSRAIRSGEYKSFDLHEDVFSYTLESESEKVTVILSFSDEDIEIDNFSLDGEPRISTYLDGPSSMHVGTLVLRPREGLVFTNFE